MKELASLDLCVGSVFVFFGVFFSQISFFCFFFVLFFRDQFFLYLLASLASIRKLLLLLKLLMVMAFLSLLLTVDGHRLVMKTAHLSTLEILHRLWEFCDAKDPKKDEAPALKTKSAKARKR